MQLIIDIGNSSVKYYYAGREFSSLDELACDRGIAMAAKPSRDDAAQTRHCEPGGRSNPPTEALIISTVPAKNNIEQDNFIIWAQQQGVSQPSVTIYDPSMSGLTNLYNGIGADRIAKLDAARSHYPKRDIILFDFGTAITMTVCSAQAELLGGFISLGLSSSLKALAACSELPDLATSLRARRAKQSSTSNGLLRRDAPCNDLARSTDEAILHGTMLAYEALIDSWLAKARDMTTNALTIATGGDREYFADSFDYSFSSACLFNDAALQ